MFPCDQLCEPVKKGLLCSLGLGKGVIAVALSNLYLH